jgi:hypothetical protein
VAEFLHDPLAANRLADSATLRLIHPAALTLSLTSVHLCPSCVLCRCCDRLLPRPAQPHQQQTNQQQQQQQQQEAALLLQTKPS